MCSKISCLPFLLRTHWKIIHARCPNYSYYGKQLLILNLWCQGKGKSSFEKKSWNIHHIFLFDNPKTFSTEEEKLPIETPEILSKNLRIWPKFCRFSKFLWSRWDQQTAKILMAETTSFIYGCSVWITFLSLLITRWLKLWCQYLDSSGHWLSLYTKYQRWSV